MVLSGEWKRRMNGIQITFCNTWGKVYTSVFYLGRASKKRRDRRKYTSKLEKVFSFNRSERKMQKRFVKGMIQRKFKVAINFPYPNDGVLPEETPVFSEARQYGHMLNEPRWGEIVRELGSDDNCQKILGSKPAQEWILM
jgi:hypothetical protein